MVLSIHLAINDVKGILDAVTFEAEVITSFFCRRQGQRDIKLTCVHVIDFYHKGTFDLLSVFL